MAHRPHDFGPVVEDPDLDRHLQNPKTFHR